ncbi:unnamed protein product [Caretta caretta]
MKMMIEFHCVARRSVSLRAKILKANEIKPGEKANFFGKLDINGKIVLICKESCNQKLLASARTEQGFH